MEKVDRSKYTLLLSGLSALVKINNFKPTGPSYEAVSVITALAVVGYLVPLYKKHRAESYK